MVLLISRTWRFLTFRGLKIDNPKDLNRLLVAGVVFTWIAGIGRYWDHPNAGLWQYLGLGSVAYIFVLAFILWGLVYPVRRGPWSYKSVLTFVALTSPLAWLYAIPVERFMDVGLAVQANLWFLAIVAAWRVGLLIHFLRTYGRFNLGMIAILTLLPLTLIIVALASLNLEHAVFEIMAGIADERTDSQTVHDSVYATIFGLGVMSMILLPVLAMVYIAIAIMTWQKRQNESGSQ